MKTLFYGGTIITMADPLYAEAVLVEDEKIIAVGSEAELRTKADSFVNLDGATMLPGFIDSHSHLTEYAVASLQVNLDGITDFETLKNTIQNYIRDNNIPEGEWVVGRNYEHNLFPDGKLPTMEQIDSICPKHLLLIKHVSCHMGLVNSNVFEKYGITAETPNPKGGRYVVENGKLTGCVEESACSIMRGRVPYPPIEKIRGAHVKMQKYYASMGITTAQDGYLGSEMINVYRDLIENDALTLDIVSYVHIPHYERIGKMFDSLPKSPRLRIGGIKHFLDGEISVKTGWLREPYLDSGEYRGNGQLTDEVVLKTMEYAATHNLQIIYHSTGDAANEQFIRCLEITAVKYPNITKLRPTLIHALLMDKPMLEKAAKLGAVISFFGAQPYYWCDTYIRTIGIERTKQICPTRTALECGAVFTLHHDAPVVEPNMLEAVWSATTRVTRNGVHLDEEKISVLDALRAITVNGAYQYFEEHKKGSIEVGKFADFAILDKNPLTTDENEIRDIKVIETYKNGISIYKLKENT